MLRPGASVFNTPSPLRAPPHSRERSPAPARYPRRLAMLWVDKHRPKTLDGLDYHKPLAANMKRMVASGDFPHMLFYGPSGAGKKTRVMALLRQLHGPSVEKLKVEARTFKFGSTSTTTDLTMVTSSHHIELNPSDAGIRDRCARARTRARQATRASPTPARRL